MNPNLTIRPMTSEDFAPLATWMVTVPLWQRYGLTAERAVINFAKAAEQGEVLVTADGDVPCCGFAWAIPKGAFGRSAYLRLIGVRPDYAGAGVGSRLLTYVEEAVLQYSSELFLLVSDFNHEAQRFYQRHGYTQVGAIDGYVLPDVVELLFWRRLRPR
ncbi:MAG: GNAT family N-acetyltransferase [Anaerolineae bacterium]|nr:GNAT family N-acetyltransferase [Anaerolineae bacterium]